MSLPVARTCQWWSGRACPLCPGISDINLFCYGQSIVDLDTEISDSALDLSVAKQELDGAQVAGASVDQSCLGPPKRVGPNRRGSSPMLVSQPETSRAYWRVVMH